MSKTLLREIGRVAAFTLLMGVVQVIITLPAGYFGMPAILGTLLGCALSVMNFALMGIMLENSISKKTAVAGLVGIGYVLRLAIIAVAVVWTIKSPHINWVCTVIPLIYPRFVIGVLSQIDKRKAKKENEITSKEGGEENERP